jgi:hypothetical protein
MAAARAKLSGSSLEIFDRGPAAAGPVRVCGSSFHRHPHLASSRRTARNSAGNQSLTQSGPAADGLGCGCGAVSLPGTLRVTRDLPAAEGARSRATGVARLNDVDVLPSRYKGEAPRAVGGRTRSSRATARAEPRPTGPIARKSPSGSEESKAGRFDYFVRKTLIVVRKSIARWRTTSFGARCFAAPLIYPVSYASRSGFLPATSAASLVCGRSSSKI